jgi:hypothetical protein
MLQGVFCERAKHLVLPNRQAHAPITGLEGTLLFGIPAARKGMPLGLRVGSLCLRRQRRHGDADAFFHIDDRERVVVPDDGTRSPDQSTDTLTKLRFVEVVAVPDRGEVARLFGSAVAARGDVEEQRKLTAQRGCRFSRIKRNEDSPVHAECVTADHPSLSASPFHRVGALLGCWMQRQSDAIVPCPEDTKHLIAVVECCPQTRKNVAAQLLTRVAEARAS